MPPGTPPAPALMGLPALLVADRARVGAGGVDSFPVRRDSDHVGEVGVAALRSIGFPAVLVMVLMGVTVPASALLLMMWAVPGGAGPAAAAGEPAVAALIYRVLRTSQ